MKRVLMSFVLAALLMVPTFVQASSSADADANATVIQGGQNQGIYGSGNSNQDQSQSSKNTNKNSNKQGQGQNQDQSLSGNQSSVALTQNGAPNLRGWGIPGTATYVNMPSEFLNDTQFANVQPVAFILSFGCTFNKVHLGNMKEDGRVTVLQATNIYGNSYSTSDLDQITFYTDVKAIPAGYHKIGAVVAKGKSGNTTTEQVLGEVGLQALNMKGAKYVLISGEGMQKSTETSAWGISLGYTVAGMSDNQNTFQTGTLGIGYSQGEAGRKASAFVHAVVLTDEAGYKEITAK